MTLIDIMKLTLSQMGEDPGAGEISEFRTLLTAYINEAYQAICRDKKQKYHEESIAFSDGRAQVDGLSKDAIRILEIKDENGRKFRFRWRQTRFLFPRPLTVRIPRHIYTCRSGWSPTKTNRIWQNANATCWRITRHTAGWGLAAKTARSAAIFS